MYCDVHKGEIAEGVTPWYEVLGWERERKQGGTNALFDRRRTGTVMCNDCRQRIKYCGSPGQRGIDDDERT
jgi:hypothetical protein